jgi:holo-[acyl-carrier protein] synthase
LGTGVWRDGVAWTDIEVLKDAAGAPQLCLYGGAAVAAARLSITTWSISLSHNRTQASAFVVGVYT